MGTIVDDPVFAYAVLAVIGAGISIASHVITNNYLFATTATAIFASLVVQIINYFYVGYLDPFFLFAFLTTLLWYFALAAIVGIPFAIVRKRRGQNILIPSVRSKSKKAR
jgi:hypothetical protein